MRPNAILLVALLLFAAVAAAEEEKIGAPTPVRLDPDKLAGLGLEEFDPFPKEMVLSGRSKHSYHTFFSGEEVGSLDQPPRNDPVEQRHAHDSAFLELIPERRLRVHIRS